MSPTLLAASAETLRRLGPRQFTLTAVAEAAGVSRGTVHNALGSRDHEINTALDHLASASIETIAAEGSPGRFGHRRAAGSLTVNTVVSSGGASAWTARS